MTLLSFDRYCDEIVAQTEQLVSGLAGADLKTMVPSCPEWTLEQLLRHLGGAHRRVEATVRTRATAFVPDEQVSGIGGPEGQDVGTIVAWLREGAAELVRTLRATGPDVEVWVFFGTGSVSFWARRMAHETVVHRADVDLTLGAEFAVDQEVGADTIDEWLQIGALPQLVEARPELRELLGPGRTLHFHGTDAGPGAEAEWLIDLTGDAIVVRRAHEKAAVALRGPIADVLQVVFRRQPVSAGRVEVLGDAELLDFWLERVTFG
ncbi:maleylpyruvate isomerase N-terminal domain-containing protein [Streptomyces sp. NPDC050617]|uniref:maleylpyruvate isomerase N-terminal domain-containing protein n=1 Tax=Streptomyces sp. NPDC050617 TaxID=3154628 RepID=UPI00342FD0DA